MILCILDNKREDKFWTEWKQAFAVFNLILISMFHRASFSSIIDKHQHMHFFIQHYISLEG